jgi:hypothetical protein
MDQNKKDILMANGWNVGSIQEFLDITDEEVRQINIGTHRRICLKHALSYLNHRTIERKATLDSMTRELVDTGVDDQYVDLSRIDMPGSAEEESAQIRADLDPSE